MRRIKCHCGRDAPCVVCPRRYGSATVGGRDGEQVPASTQWAIARNIGLSRLSAGAQLNLSMTQTYSTVSEKPWAKFPVSEQPN